MRRLGQKKKINNTEEVKEGVYLPRRKLNSDFTNKEKTEGTGRENTQKRFLTPPRIWCGPGITDRQQ